MQLIRLIKKTAIPTMVIVGMLISFTPAQAAIVNTTGGGHATSGDFDVTGVTNANGNVNLGDNAADAIDLTGVTNLNGGAVTVATGSSLTANDAVTLGDAAGDAIAINGNSTFADGATVTINSDTIDFGDEATDAIDLTGVTNLNGGAVTIATGSSLTANDAVTLGDAAGDAIAINGNSTFADGATVTINSDTIDFGDEATDAIDLTGAINLNGGAVTVATGSSFSANDAVNLGDAAGDALDLTGTINLNGGAVTVATGSSLTANDAVTLGDAAGDAIAINGNSTFADGATVTINSDTIDFGDEATDAIDLTGAVNLNGGVITVADGSELRLPGAVGSDATNEGLVLGDEGGQHVELTAGAGNALLVNGASITALNGETGNIANYQTDGVVENAGSAVYEIFDAVNTEEMIQFCWKSVFPEVKIELTPSVGGSSAILRGHQATQEAISTDCTAGNRTTVDNMSVTVCLDNTNDQLEFHGEGSIPGGDHTIIATVQKRDQ